MSVVNAIPTGYSGALPYLTIKNANAALAFYQQAFGAQTIMQLAMPDGSLMHGEMRLGEAVFMLSEQNDEWGSKSPDMLGGSPVSVMIYVADVDALLERAVAAGATLTMPATDQFWGDRSGCVLDPFGHNWMFSTHIEDVSPEQMAQRAAQMFG